MNSKLNQAIRELFEQLTPAQRIGGMWFMKEMTLASQAKAPVFDAVQPGTDQDPTIADMMTTFEECGFQNRIATVFYLISDIAESFQETIRLCKEDSAHMDNLTVKELCDVVRYEHEKATANLLKHFPQSADVLLSLDYLASFGVSVEDHTPEDVARLKSSLMDVWDWQAGK